MYADPQTITINAIAIPLPRTSTGVNGAEYTSADGLVKLSAQSTYGRRTRRVLRLDHSKISADVFVPATNVQQSISIYTVFDVPGKAGYTNAEILLAYAGYKAALAASSDLLVTKLLGGES